MGDAKDDWVRSSLEVDPAAFANMAEGLLARAGATLDTIGEAAAAVARANQKAHFTAAYTAAKPGLDRAAARAVVATGAAADAQKRLLADMAAIVPAVRAEDWEAAQKSLDAALLEAKIVMAAPDPAMVAPIPGKHPEATLYGKEPGDGRDISETDINQDSLGDCYLLSSIGEIARIKPELIRQMIHDNGDGTYTVTLRKEKSGLGYLIGKITGQEFEDVKVVVDGNIGTGAVDSAPGQAQVGDKQEIWVQVVEKAYAKLHGGYDKIDQGGWAAPAMENLTGKRAAGKPAASVSAADLEDAIKKGKPVVMDTPTLPPGTGNPFNLVGPHAYMLEAIRTDKAGNKFIKLRNPWGFQNPPEIPFAQLSTVIQTIEEGSQL